MDESRHSFRHLDLKHLRQLTEVADKGSIRAAAESLAITQPALSRSIRSIENELGIKLVDRGPRGAELTTAGTRLLSYARIIDANLTSAENELRGLRDRSSRTEQIAFGMSWLTEALIAAQLIGRVLRQRPGIRLTTIVGDFESLAPKLASGRLEFFVGPPPIGGRHPGITSQPLTEFPAGVVVRAAHPLARQKELTVQHLVAAQWILPVAGTIPRITYDNSFLRRGVAPPEPLFEVQPLSPVIRQLLRDSDLVTILPLVVVERGRRRHAEGAAVRRRDHVPDPLDAAPGALPFRGARLRHRRAQGPVSRARAAQSGGGARPRTRGRDPR